MTALAEERVLQRAGKEIRRRAAHLETVNAIIAAAATATDLPDLLRIALDQTLRALGLEMGIIWLPGQHVPRGLPPELGPAMAQMAQAAGLDIPGPIAVEDWEQVGRQARSESGVPSDGTPLRSVPDYEPLRGLMARFGIRASLTVPITSTGPGDINVVSASGEAQSRRIGGLSLASPEPRPWSAGEIALVEAMGRQLGAMAERLRLFQEIQTHGELMTRLASISESLNRPLTVDEVVVAIGQGALALSGAERAAVYLRHPDDTVACPWSHGLSPAYVEEVVARVRELPGGRLLERPDPVLVPDVEGLPEDSPARGLAEAGSYRAFGVWPLVYQGRVVAAVACYFEAARSWPEAEQEAMEAFARQAAVTLENARLYVAERGRRQELDALYGLSRQLVATDAMETILASVVRYAVETVRVTFCRLLTLEEDGAFVCRAAHPVRVLDCGLGVGQPEPAPAWPHYQQALSQAKPLVLRQGAPALSPGEHQALFLAPSPALQQGSEPALSLPKGPALVQSLCLAPLQVGDKTIGVLALGEVRSEVREPFDADKLRLAASMADQAASAIHRASLHEQTQQHLQRLAVLRAIDMAISGSVDLRVTLNVLLDQITAQLGVDAADVLLLNPDTQTLEYAAGRGFHPDVITRASVRLGDALAGRAALERRIIAISDLRLQISDWERQQSEISNLQSAIQAEGFVAYYAVPLIAKGQVKGVLETFHRTPLGPDPEWLDFLEALATQAAIAIDNAELLEDLQRSNVELTRAYDSTLQGWARALELRDKETEGHSRRVTEMTLRLARAMGMRDEELVHVYRGTLLHDIGKMGVPDSILLKPGSPTDEEWGIIRQHPVYGYEMLAPITFLRPALDIPRCHHERWDGTGYPQGLEGEQIPLAARIFAVVDVYDALCSPRPYRPAWPEDKARQYIREQAGQHFDPQVVDVFLGLLETDDEFVVAPGSTL